MEDADMRGQVKSKSKLTPLGLSFEHFKVDLPEHFLSKFFHFREQVDVVDCQG